MRVTIHSRQSLLDVAVRECGSFEAAFTLAVRNGLSMTDDLVAGQELEYISEEVTNKRIVALLAARGVKPATALAMPAAQPLGIGYMTIGIDFIIS